MVIQPGTPVPLANGSWFDNMVVISYHHPYCVAPQNGLHDTTKDKPYHIFHPSSYSSSEFKE